MLKKIALVGVFAVASFMTFSGSSKASIPSAKPSIGVGAPVAHGICGCFKC